MSRPPKKKAKGNRKIVLTLRKKPAKVVLETKVPDSMVTGAPSGDWLLWGFTRADRESWFVDVYHHKSLVFYETREGAEKVREYGEKLRQVRVKVEYV